MYLGKKLERDETWPVRRTMKDFGVVEISYTWAPRKGGQEYGVATIVDFRGLDYLTAVDLMSGSGLVVRIQGKLRSVVNNTDLSADEKTKALAKWIGDGRAHPTIKVATEFAYKVSEVDPFETALKAMTAVGVGREDAVAMLKTKGVTAKDKAADKTNPIVIADAVQKAAKAA